MPGDSIFVKNGIYREEIYISGKNGGPNYITLQNFPGHSPVIQGSGVDGGRNKIANSSFIKMAGFAIENFQQGIFVEESSNVILERLTVRNVGQEAVRIRLNSKFIVVRDSTIHDTRKWKYNGEGVYIGTSTSQQPEAPPFDNTHDVLVKNNTIYNVSDECIEIKEGTYNVVIDGNYMHNCLLDPAINSPTWGAIEVMEHRKYYNDNPNHIIKNNIIRTAKTGIGVHTGSAVFNNVIYGQTGIFRGISVDNPAADRYPRHIYHNTVDLPPSRAVVVAGGTVDIRNNIGPNLQHNIPVSDAFFMSKATGNYHLMMGSAPIGAGADLSQVVSSDIEGNSRSEGARPDMGAYEFRRDRAAPGGPDARK